MDGRNGQVLAGLRLRFEGWRRRRSRGARIPVPLWRAAVDAAREHGISKASRLLGVDYYALRQRLAAARPPAPQAPTFVEVAPRVLASGPECVLEVQDREGRKLRIELQDASRAEALARSLWNASR